MIEIDPIPAGENIVVSSETKFGSPKVSIPEPLRGTDPDSFAQATVARRLPEILRRVLKENEFPLEITSRLEELLAEIPPGQIRPLRDDRAPDSESWERYVQPYLGLTWLQVPWFFAETYFYRRILEATGYFRPGSGYGIDPYGLQKRRDLETSQVGIQSIATQVNSWLDSSPRHANQDGDRLARLMKTTLWGNQADLSMWSNDERPDHHNVGQQDAHILVDDTPAAVNHLSKSRNQLARLDFILDNAGLELVYDLGLADYLLSSQYASTILMHTKPHPTFVSDTMVKDVQEMVGFLSADSDPDVRLLGQRLQEHLQAGRLGLRDDFFWTSPLPFWEMPSSLRQQLSGLTLIVSKGDANYRRLLGDRHWPYTTPIADILGYLPAPLVVLRVLKSEVIAGLSPEKVAEMNAIDTQWLFNGRWGVIQFVDCS